MDKDIKTLMFLIQKKIRKVKTLSEFERVFSDIDFSQNSPAYMLAFGKLDDEKVIEKILSISFHDFYTISSRLNLKLFKLPKKAHKVSTKM